MIMIMIMMKYNPNPNPKNLTLGVPELPAFYGGVGGGFGQPPLLPRPPGQDAAEVLPMRRPLVQQGGTQSGFQVKVKKARKGAWRVVQVLQESE